MKQTKKNKLKVIKGFVELCNIAIPVVGLRNQHQEIRKFSLVHPYLQSPFLIIFWNYQTGLCLLFLHICK